MKFKQVHYGKIGSQVWCYNFNTQVQGLYSVHKVIYVLNNVLFIRYSWTLSGGVLSNGIEPFSLIFTLLSGYPSYRFANKGPVIKYSIIENSKVEDFADS